MVDMSAYKQPVHRSLLQRELLGGIPQAGLLLLFMLAVILGYGLELYFIAIPLVIVLYVIMRALTKRDQWLIDIVLDNIMQKDKLIP